MVVPLFTAVCVELALGSHTCGHICKTKRDISPVKAPARDATHTAASQADALPTDDRRSHARACVSFSRRKCESAVCVECVFFRRRFARPSARRRSAHSLNS